MQAHQTSTDLPPILARRRNAIIASALSSLIFVVGGVFINGNFSMVASDDVLSILAMSAICLAPFLGLPATILGANDLKNIRKKVIPSSLYKVTKWGRHLGVIGTSGNIILLFIFFVQALSISGVSQARDSMVADLKNLFGLAYHYRMRPDSANGGAGSYAGFSLDPSLAGIEHGFYKANVFHPDTIQFIARWREDSNSAIVVKLGPDGRPAGNWIFGGSFKD